MHEVWDEGFRFGWLEGPSRCDADADAGIAPAVHERA